MNNIGELRNDFVDTGRKALEEENKKLKQLLIKILQSLSDRA